MAKGKNTSDTPLTVSIDGDPLDKEGARLKSGVLFATGIDPQALFRIEEPIASAKAVQQVQITGIRVYEGRSRRTGKRSQVPASTVRG